MKKIIDVLKSANTGAVLFDERNNTVRLWTLSQSFLDGRKLRALRRFFPSLEINGEIIRLGGYNSLAEGNRSLAEAKVYSRSREVNNLYHFDTDESVRTIKHLS